MAFEELYRRIRDVAYRYAFRVLGSQEAAEEAAQEILVKVYRARASYRPRARFRTWLYRVATNHCINERQRAWRQREVGVREGTAGLSAPGAVGDDPAARQEAGEVAQALQRALEALPPRQRAAVVLARYEGCTMAEVAQALDCSSPGAAKQLLHRARSRLQLALAPYLSPTAAQEA